MNAKCLGCPGSGSFIGSPVGSKVLGHLPGGGTEFESWPEKRGKESTKEEGDTQGGGGEIKFGGEVEGQGG